MILFIYFTAFFLETSIKNSVDSSQTPHLDWVCTVCIWASGPEVIKLFSCPNELSMKFFLLINVKMPTIGGILTFFSGKNSILCLSEPKNCRISSYFYTYVYLKKFYNSGPALERLKGYMYHMSKINDITSHFFFNDIKGRAPSTSASQI